MQISLEDALFPFCYQYIVPPVISKKALSSFWRNIVIVSFIFMMLLPFVLIRDIYPFFRFGMFAEPVEAQVNTEHFLIFYQKGNKEKTPLRAEDIGLKPTLYEYVLRNHWYRNEGDQLLSEVQQIDEHKADSYFLAKVVTDHLSGTRDTVILLSQERP